MAQQKGILKIEGTMGLTIPKFLFKRKSVTVKVGKIFYLPKNMKYPRDLNKASELIIKKLRSI